MIIRAVKYSDINGLFKIYSMLNENSIFMNKELHKGDIL